ncbi:MAG: hypothetical protein J7604_21055 [Sporocytophaga sp.]|uniref:hypothetical protein n=1 Tax=Sporocytophaga sp. TaxID=2231183 RepID=UPI001B2DCF65|nr:hypothetical protein [Sporocytophaga sp.]MBO9702714.1 hypothetical protein [Sporocytophaga sp.]
MTTKQARQLIQLLTGKGVHFITGLEDDEVLQIEIKFSLEFPPDLRLFLQTALPISDKFLNWRLGLTSKEEADKISDRLDWPLNGMLFDLKENDFWFDSWGTKPKNFEEQVAIANQHYLTYPKLIPIYSHRYIPAHPKENGNPVFSVYQMDIIYYGYDLATYFAHEFNFSLSEDFEPLTEPKKIIDFWSECN